MGFEQSKLEYEGKQLLVEEAEKFLKNAVEDMKESAREQYKKDVENFNKIKAETNVRWIFRLRFLRQESWEKLNRNIYKQGHIKMICPLFMI